jgi:hypothetical protein
MKGLIIGIVIGAAAVGLVPVIQNDELSTDKCRERTAYLDGKLYRNLANDKAMQAAVRENYDRWCGFKGLLGWAERRPWPWSAEVSVGGNRQGGI